MLLASHVPRSGANHGHTHGNVGRAHVSTACERGKSLDMDVEELAKSDCLGVTQMREVARYVLDGSMALAELDSKRASANIAHGRGIAVLRQGVSEGLRTHARIRPGITHDRGVSPFDLA